MAYEIFALILFLSNLFGGVTIQNCATFGYKA